MHHAVWTFKKRWATTICSGHPLMMIQSINQRTPYYGLLQTVSHAGWPAAIAFAVAIGVKLVGIVNGRAVVNGIRNAVVIGISEHRSRIAIPSKTCKACSVGKIVHRKAACAGIKNRRPHRRRSAQKISVGQARSALNLEFDIKTYKRRILHFYHVKKNGDGDICTMPSP